MAAALGSIATFPVSTLCSWSLSLSLLLLLLLLRITLNLDYFTLFRLLFFISWISFRLHLFCCRFAFSFNLPDNSMALEMFYRRVVSNPIFLDLNTFQIRICFVKRFFVCLLFIIKKSLWLNVCSLQVLGTRPYFLSIYEDPTIACILRIYFCLLHSITHTHTHLTSIALVLYFESYINRQQVNGTMLFGVFQVADFVLFRSTFNFSLLFFFFLPFNWFNCTILWRINISRFWISSCFLQSISDPSRIPYMFKFDYQHSLSTRCSGMWSNIEKI